MLQISINLLVLVSCGTAATLQLKSPTMLTSRFESSRLCTSFSKLFSTSIDEIGGDTVWQAEVA